MRWLPRQSHRTSAPQRRGPSRTTWPVGTPLAAHHSPGMAPWQSAPPPQPPRSPGPALWPAAEPGWHAHPRPVTMQASREAASKQGTEVKASGEQVGSALNNAAPAQACAAALPQVQLSAASAMSAAT